MSKFVACQVCGKELIGFPPARRLYCDACAIAVKREYNRIQSALKRARRLDEAALAQDQNRQRPVPATRECLKCGKQFRPDGLYNRLCGRCRQENTFIHV